MLRDLTRDKLLLAEALRMGVESTEEDEETIISDVVNQYVLIADFLGLDSLQVEEGTTLIESVSRAVRGPHEPPRRKRAGHRSTGATGPSPSRPIRAACRGGGGRADCSTGGRTPG